jgi:hypothetical protein
MINEHKKGVKAVKYNAKPRNFVAKNAGATTSGAGAHKDKKKAMKQGEIKHKAKELAESVPYDKKLDFLLKAAVIKDKIRESVTTEGAKVDRQAKHITASMMKKGKSKKDAEAIAWAHIKHPKKKKTNEGIEPDNAEYNDEAGMARGSLKTMHRAVIGLAKTIGEGDNLPEWCQEKLSLAEDYLVTVWDYLQSEQDVAEAGSAAQQAAIAVNMKKHHNRPNNESGYNHGFADPNAPSLGGNNEFRNRERNAGLEHETNNIAIAINGKTWKVVPGKGYADSKEERAYLNHMKSWAEKKSASSGKKWTAHLTGAPATD